MTACNSFLRNMLTEKGREECGNLNKLMIRLKTSRLPYDTTFTHNMEDILLVEEKLRGEVNSNLSAVISHPGKQEKETNERYIKDALILALSSSSPTCLTDEYLSEQGRDYLRRRSEEQETHFLLKVLCARVGIREKDEGEIIINNYMRSILTDAEYDLFLSRYPRQDSISVALVSGVKKLSREAIESDPKYNHEKNTDLDDIRHILVRKLDRFCYNSKERGYLSPEEKEDISVMAHYVLKDLRLWKAEERKTSWEADYLKRDNPGAAVGYTGRQ